MNDNEKDKLDLLIKRNAEQQLDRVDWQKLNATISSRLNKAGKTTALSLFVFKVAAAAAVIVVVLLVAKFLFVERPVQTPEKVSLSTITMTSSPGNNLIARTDPETILLTGQYHIVSNDELLKPHSVWAQKPVCCAN